MGKKIIDFKTQHDVSRGRKSKAGGGKNQKRLNYIHPCFNVNTLSAIKVLLVTVAFENRVRKRLSSFQPKIFDRSSRFTAKEVPIIRGQFNIIKSQKNLGPQHVGH